MNRVSLIFSVFTIACVPAVAVAAGGYLGSADQKAALLSPTPLGPAAPLEQSEAGTRQVTTVAPVVPETRTAPKPKRSAVQKRPRTNPLDSFARDTRPAKKTRGLVRQTWPCTGGGICAWTSR